VREETSPVSPTEALAEPVERAPETQSASCSRKRRWFILTLVLLPGLVLVAFGMYSDLRDGASPLAIAFGSLVGGVLSTIFMVMFSKKFGVVGAGAILLAVTATVLIGIIVYIFYSVTHYGS
jgi:FtsH-binding integral membrane protein